MLRLTERGCVGVHVTRRDAINIALRIGSSNACTTYKEKRPLRQLGGRSTRHKWRACCVRVSEWLWRERGL